MQFAGQATMQSLSVRNAGGDALEFDVRLETQGGALDPREITLFFDDMEHGAEGWTSEVYGEDDLWHLSNNAVHSGEKSWWCGVAGQSSYGTEHAISTALITP